MADKAKPLGFPGLHQYIQDDARNAGVDVQSGQAAASFYPKSIGGQLGQIETAPEGSRREMIDRCREHLKAMEVTLAATRRAVDDVETHYFGGDVASRGVEAPTGPAPEPTPAPFQSSTPHYGPPGQSPPPYIPADQVQAMTGTDEPARDAQGHARAPFQQETPHFGPPGQSPPPFLSPSVQVAPDGSLTPPSDQPTPQPTGEPTRAVEPTPQAEIDQGNRSFVSTNAPPPPVEAETVETEEEFDDDDFEESDGTADEPDQPEGPKKRGRKGKK